MSTRSRTSSGVAAALLLLGLASVTGCSSEVGDGSDRELTVYAAASLRSTFESLADTFEASHEGVDVLLSFAGSSDLVAQIQQGAPADVIATADERTMEKLVADDLVAGEPQIFATNTLELVVPPGNPADVAQLSDLDARGEESSQVRLVICAPEVPCGAAAVELADLAGVEFAPVSEEQSVSDVLGKVTSGEADAGLVYVTDALAAGAQVQAVDVPETDDVVNNYPAAKVADALQSDLADEFLELLLGNEGRQVLQESGFGQP